ncbi:MAG: ABC transporter permease [Deltaproteobacteria bacterium]|nr:ABC transporter permease [Deltaproteobacteria bacterium]
MLWNTFLLALRAIRRNVMRSFLTILGIVIGIAAVITLVTVGNGATKSVADQIANMGTNQIIIIPGQHFGPGSSDAPNFKLVDVQLISEQLSSIKAIAPISNKSVTAIYQSRNWSTVIFGTTNDYFVSSNWEFAEGHQFNDTDLKTGKAVCVIGETVREKLFGQEAPVGSEIRIKGFACEIIGLLKSKGQAGMGHDQDDVIVMPLRTVQRRLLGSSDINRIMVAVNDGDSINNVKAQLSSLLRERRKLAPSEDDDFRILDTRQLAETFTGTTKILTMLLAAVAAVSLLVGGIGIMNIMLVSVTERTREIGIRLAIGALGREVLLQFLMESVVLSAIGGLIGVALATGGSIALTSIMNVPYIFDSKINIIALLFSAAIGVIFGYFPAQRAARLNPIDALRYE